MSDGTAAELPEDAADLRAYLDRTVSGSNSHGEAIFVAITDSVQSNLLPPKTLAAALEVLALACTAGWPARRPRSSRRPLRRRPL
jgi:hypothetical protein